MKELEVFVLFKGDPNFHYGELVNYQGKPNGADLEIWYPGDMSVIENKEIKDILVNASELERVVKNEGN